MKSLSTILAVVMMLLYFNGAATSARPPAENHADSAADPALWEKDSAAALFAGYTSPSAVTDKPAHPTEPGQATPKRPQFRPILEPPPGEHGMAPQKIQDTDVPALPGGKSSMNKGAIHPGVSRAAGNSGPVRVGESHLSGN